MGLPPAPHPGPEARARRLAELTRQLGVPLPRLEGPIIAFQAEGKRGAADPVFLVGDLNAVHPRVDPGGIQNERDPSLECATVVLDDHENPAIELAATQGLWGVRMEDERLPMTPFFSVTDTNGHIRAWLLLPAPRYMVGLTSFWLPSIRPCRG